MSFPKGRRNVFVASCFLIEIIFIALFAVFADYEDAAVATKQYQINKDNSTTRWDHSENSIKVYYGMFQDVHVMIFIGFGFLMVYLKRYGFSGIGFNFLLGAFVLQWATLIHGWLHLENGKFLIGVKTLLASDFASAAVLISFGAVLGKTSPMQLLIMGLIEVVVQQLNEWVGVHLLHAIDIGESMYVHVFGAYFGLAVVRMLYTNKFYEAKHKYEISSYDSDLYAAIGSVFLWLYWPSFNSAASHGDAQLRAVINTYFSLAACTVTTFGLSILLTHDKRLEMIHIQNAALAGGVAIGTVADLMISPYGAMTVGAVAATISVVGYACITPLLEKRFKVYDTCGVHNLHGMPGVLAGLAGAAASAIATFDRYGYTLYTMFPARAPVGNSTELFAVQAIVTDLEPGLGRSAGVQAGFQLAALAVTLIIALASGLLTGLLMTCSIFEPVCDRSETMFNDRPFWEVPPDFEFLYEEKEVEPGELEDQQMEGLIMKEDV